MTKPPKKPELTPPGNRSEGSKDYKDPVGSQDKMNPPKNSGYDEKQPKNPEK